MCSYSKPPFPPTVIRPSKITYFLIKITGYFCLLCTSENVVFVYFKYINVFPEPLLFPLQFVIRKMITQREKLKE